MEFNVNGDTILRHGIDGKFGEFNNTKPKKDVGSNIYVWHRCEDELPKKRGLYYVTDFTGRAFCCSYGFWPDFNSHEINKGWYYFEDPKDPYNGIVDMDRNVIAWTELPEPYKEDF